MGKLKKFLQYFTKGELALWSSSVILIAVSFCVFDRENWLTLAASLVGATALIFCAKGNPAGQALMVVFSILYAIISWSFAYYGEMITYLGMSMPMALVALVTWLKHPYNGKRAQVKINRLKGKEVLILAALSLAVTVAFYFILKAFGTANLIPSTISVTTSFFAVSLAFRRSPLFALAYAANDAVLIVLWILATLEDVSYLSVVICFAMFLANDTYSFINWTRMQKKQSAAPAQGSSAPAAEHSEPIATEQEDPAAKQ